MAGPISISQGQDSSVQTNLRAIAQMLHNGGNLDPQARAALADFLDELRNTLKSTPIPSSDLAHLTECAVHLLQTEQHPNEEARAAAGERLEKAILAVQTQFPTVAGIARVFVDTLASIGI